MPVTLADAVHSTLEIRKSRFLGCVEPIADRQAALARVNALRVLHPGATHVCWALLAGGHSAAVDDGEPSGTAAQPMLKVLRHHDLDGVLATVVRYFGGVKLGAGGLVRAYTDAVAQALINAEKIAIQVFEARSCSVPYALEGLVRRLLDSEGAQIQTIDHQDVVRFRFSIPQSTLPLLLSRLGEATNGRIEWHDDR